MDKILGSTILAAFHLVWLADSSLAAVFTGTILDADTRQPLPARVYVQASQGEWLFVQSADDAGSALPYREQWVPMPNSVERHTTLSAHPFSIELAPGKYVVTIERGKEYLPLTKTITIRNQPCQHTFHLKRWSHLAALGWYSGETHVHRRIEELPNVMLAEDLNVAFPVTFWTTRAFEPPGLNPSPLRSQGPSPFGPRTDRGHTMRSVDSTHVIFPRNTEYEIFSVGRRSHVLGAVFILNHKTRFRRGAPPIAEIAAQAHAEGALLDLDKHNWPWSMMLVPVANVDLFELSNNSVWRTNFGFRPAANTAPPFMTLHTDEHGMTEWGWLQFGFQSYYMLLNCGFRLQPTAGTASGVHPVPLGFSRVYVHVGEPFDAAQWIDGLRQGRSFVTTGPMLLATLSGEHPGKVYRQPQSKKEYELQIESISERPIDRIEVVVNGRVRKTIRPPDADRIPNQPVIVKAKWSVPIDRSSWIAVRSFQVDEAGRVRFAHTAPWHLEVANRPIRPPRREIEYLIHRMREEIARNEDVLPKPALDEFRKALEIYEGIRSHHAPQ